MQELLTYKDVAGITKFKISTLRKWVQLRKMPFVKINGSIRFSAGAIGEWMAGKAVGKNGADAAVDGAGNNGAELFDLSEGPGLTDRGQA
jgi:excisionase family DNA binding protein